MAVYSVWVEVIVESTDESGDDYVELPEAEYMKIASFRDHKKAVSAALQCVAHLEAIKQPARQAARAKKSRAQEGD